MLINKLDLSHKYLQYTLEPHEGASLGLGLSCMADLLQMIHVDAEMANTTLPCTDLFSSWFIDEACCELGHGGLPYLKSGSSCLDQTSCYSSRLAPMFTWHIWLWCMHVRILLAMYYNIWCKQVGNKQHAQRTCCFAFLQTITFISYTALKRGLFRLFNYVSPVIR